MKRLTVIGAGVSGTALALFARKLGAEVFVSEERNVSTDASGKLKNAGIEWEAGGHTRRAFEADALLLSSGIPPFAPCVRKAEERGLPVVGELDFVVPHIKGRIVGITGSGERGGALTPIGRNRKTCFYTCAQKESVFLIQRKLKLQHDGNLQHDGSLTFFQSGIICL